jgi:hypothetical protein
MTHPPSGPVTPPPPSGPRTPQITPLDPDSEAGRQAAEALSQVLAEIQVAIWRRKAAADQQVAA